MKKIHIVGGGFSGLSLAYLLGKTRRFDISVFEKTSHLGGMIQSHIMHNGVVESAANSILCTDQTLRFLEEINVDYVRPLPTAKKRYFFRNRLTQWPLTIFETIFFVPKVLFHLITQKKFLTPKAHQTVSEWSEKFLGKAFTKYILSPGLQGIYATTADQLNAQAVIGPILLKKKSKYRGIVSGKKGMHDIIDALEKKCHENNVTIHLNAEYAPNDPHTTVVVCTSAKDAAQTLMLQHPKIAQLLEKIQMNTVLSLTCWTDLSERPHGFGALIPQNENVKCLGVLFNSDIFPNRNSETYIFSDNEAEKINQLSDIDLKLELKNIRKEIFGLNREITHIQRFYWPQSLPLYDSNVLDFQSKLTLPPRLYLHGNYVSGIGLSKIVSGSYELSEKIIKDLI